MTMRPVVSMARLASVARVATIARVVSVVGSALLLAAAPRTASAQDPRLRARLEAPTAVAVQAVIDSAAAAGLPTEPLALRALEGASRGADGARIVDAVRSLAARMETARRALGRSVTEPELVAAAGALYRGVQPNTLERLRRTGRGRTLTVPLVVLADLLERGVPAKVASDCVERLMPMADDTSLLVLGRMVQQDIAAGASPTSAAESRVAGILVAVPLAPPPPPHPSPAAATAAP
ncbi:MAG TPA: hypothetical protein VFS33_09150 [Gemmatimonadales bacterium]|nr:hypothetical protein [Gemmatimonadales bacterium]